MYTLTQNNTGVIRDLDGAFIPNDPKNFDYQTYLAWVNAGNTPTPYSPPTPTVGDVVAERERRMALGFDYNFNDVRGIHHFGTTAADMIGWDRVSKLAAALLATNNTTTTITIVTDTGQCNVTAGEWQQILLASGSFEQPLYLKSFTLQAMNPIPSDYTNDKYWV